MGNIGSEVSRALNWRKKGRKDISERAVERALELLGLSLDSDRTFPRLKELTRVREALVDYFYGDNEFSSSETSWRKYFDCFAYIVRKDI
jgi:hypothetical protein